jgi:hypothetical protein
MIDPRRAKTQAGPKAGVAHPSMVDPGKPTELNSVVLEERPRLFHYGQH